MRSDRSQPPRDDHGLSELELGRQLADDDAPRPSARFRRRAWTEFQREIDPLAQPRPFRAFRLFRQR